MYDDDDDDDELVEIDDDSDASDDDVDADPDYIMSALMQRKTRSRTNKQRLSQGSMDEGTAGREQSVKPRTLGRCSMLEYAS